MSDRGSAAEEELERLLSAAGARKRRIDAEREDNRADLHALYQQGKKMGVSAGQMARWTGQNEQVVRNILGKAVRYQDKKAMGRV